MEDVVKDAFDPTRYVVAVDDASPYARHSVRNALVNGYSAFKGGSGKIAGLLNGAQDVAGQIASDLSGGGLAGMLAKFGLRALTNSPVTPLQREPYEEAAVGRAIRDICERHPLVLYVRKPYRDNKESRNFLCHTCGVSLDLILPQHHGKLLVLLCLRDEDVKKELGKEIKELAGESEHVQFVRLQGVTKSDEGEEDEDTSPLGRLLREAPADALRMLKHVYAYSTASDSKLFTKRLIDVACSLDGNDKPFKWLTAKGVIEEFSQDGNHAVWTVSDRYDRWDLDTALYEVTLWHEEREAAAEEEEDNDAEEQDDEDEEEQAEEEDSRSTDEIVADNLYGAIVATEGELPTNLRALFRLAASGSRRLSGVPLAGKIAEQAAQGGSVGRLESLLGEIGDFFDNAVFGAGEGLQAADEEWAGIVDCVDRFTRALKHLQAVAWGPVHGNLGGVLGRLVDLYWEAIPEGLDREAKEAAERNAAYLHFLTGRGRMKLVSLSSSLLHASSRLQSGWRCVRKPERDGHLSELHAVRRSQLAWFFASDGQVIAFPLSGIDTTFEEEADGVFENMSVYLDLRAKWEASANHFLATCPIEGPEIRDSGLSVLLVNEAGNAHAVPVSTLPAERGERVQLSSPLLSSGSPARWAVIIRPDDNLLIATTGNQILRLKVSAVLSELGGTVGRLMHIEPGETLAAVVGVPHRANDAEASSDVSSYVLIATDGGYGRLVSISEFPYGKLGGKGLVGQKVGKHSGSICTIEVAREGGHFILGTRRGHILRIPRAEMPIRNRTSVGLRLIKLAEDDQLVS